MIPEADLIADVVLQQFDRLPAKRKPKLRDNGLREWVPLSGIVATEDGSLKCLALATGMKCLPAAKLPLSNGVGLHDWHAEVLVVRAFNNLLLEECRQVAMNGPDASSIIRPRSIGEMAGDGDEWHRQPFALRDGIKLHMYCSEAPCGDASMELTMAAQEDATPWGEPEIIDESEQTLPGRGYFSRLGIVRRKPARADAPPTISKSCSDKLALKQCASLLSSVVALLISPEAVYLDSVVLPQAQLHAGACERAFSAGGRMRGLFDRSWPGGYSFRPFMVASTSRDFAFSRGAAMSRSGVIAASNAAVAWTCRGLEEGFVGGVLQGRRAFDLRGAGRVSRRGMWALAVDVASLLDDDCAAIQAALALTRYRDIKACELTNPRAIVKRRAREDALRGWTANEGDDKFRLGTAEQSVDGI